MKTLVLGSALTLGLLPAALGQLMVVDQGASSTSPERVMLFREFDGSLIDADWITEANAGGQWAMSTPKEAAAVGNEIWVTDQVQDAVLRFDTASKAYLGSITMLPNGAAMDNLRGLGVGSGVVYVANGTLGTGNVNRGIASYDFAGNPLNFFNIGTVSPFDVEPWRGELVISDSTSDSVQRWSLGGVLQGTFAANLEFPQQVVVLPDESVIAVATISVTPALEGVYHFNSDGTLRVNIPTDTLGSIVPRGAYPTGDGGYLLAADTGVYKASNSGSGWSWSQVYSAANCQYVTLLPEPTSLALLALCVLGVRRRG